MRSRILFGALLLAGVMPLGPLTTGGEATTPPKWAAVTLQEPTFIAGVIAYGPVLVEHDDARMARGEPCTAVYRFVAGKGPGEKIASFHCTPRWSESVGRFQFAIRHDASGTCVLTEYQFAGDTEAHGVPATNR
jgi:hypothetical protein